MNRTFVVISWLVMGLMLGAAPGWAAELYVAPDGSDVNPGTKSKPLATILRARDAIRSLNSAEPVTVYLRGGTYELTRPVVFTPRDSGTDRAPVTYWAYQGEQVVISGGPKLDLQWKPWRDGIMQAKVASDKPIDQLFVNSKRQHLARWPNHPSKSGGMSPVNGEAFSLAIAVVLFIDHPIPRPELRPIPWSVPLPRLLPKGVPLPEPTPASLPLSSALVKRLNPIPVL